MSSDSTPTPNACVYDTDDSLDAVAKLATSQHNMFPVFIALMACEKIVAYMHGARGKIQRQKVDRGGRTDIYSASTMVVSRPYIKCQIYYSRKKMK